MGLTHSWLQKEGLYFTRAEMMHLRPDYTLTVKDVTTSTAGNDNGTLAPMMLALRRLLVLEQQLPCQTM